jgi:acetylornithine deacetylase
MTEYINLLKQLIETPSFSKEEDKTAQILTDFFHGKGIPVNRNKNNVWTCNAYFSPEKPTILLNSHHDTVKPNASYTLNPFQAIEQDGKLYGLGSNDAGGCLVSLIAAFCHFYHRQDLQYNLILAASAEEEISGRDGIEFLQTLLPPVDFAIVGEPTQMQMAIAEKGLMVLDCIAYGKAGHAARDEGENAIYKAMEDIQVIKEFRFEKVSEWLGNIKMSVTILHAGTQHNVVPDRCEFTIDVRTTDAYSNEEVLELLKSKLKSEVKARSTRLKPSHISESHAIVVAGKSLGLSVYGSPTLSDQALLKVPSLKIGPGDSARSHTADEFVMIEEIERGIETYIHLLEKVIL